MLLAAAERAASALLSVSLDADGEGDDVRVVGPCNVPTSPLTELAATATGSAVPVGDTTAVGVCDILPLLT